MTTATNKRPAKKLPEMEQASLCFNNLHDVFDKNKAAQTICFREGDTGRLFIGDMRLEKYLEDNGLGFVVRLSEYLNDYDFCAFIKSYSQIGRHAIHPRIILGLVIYGMLSKQWSLRQLESLALRDVGAWWICGGLQPDHSTIGKFFNQHSEILSEDFFISLTQQLVRKLNLKTHDAAGDGTVIEAASSQYRILKAEAARLAAKTAEDEASLDPENKEKKAKSELSKEAADFATKRQATLKKIGKPNGNVCVSSNEPQATVQPLKNKINRPAYKPSILVDQNRLIVGQHLHPTNEAIAIKPMLKQHEEIYGYLPACTLLDAGYNTLDILQTFVALKLDVLCPAGAVEKTGKWKKQSHQQKLTKSDFQYDATRDVYICRENKDLTIKQTGQNIHGQKFRQYLGRECGICPMRPSCTASKQGRTIKRFEGEELKEAMAQVLQHPRAKERYSRRKAMVEPVFAELKERQALKRFHRRGLRNVKVEFALHCVAYNLKRAIRLSEGLCLVFFMLYWRKNYGPWKIHSFYTMLLFTRA